MLCCDMLCYVIGNINNYIVMDNCRFCISFSYGNYPRFVKYKSSLIASYQDSTPLFSTASTGMKNHYSFKLAFSYAYSRTLGPTSKLHLRNSHFILLKNLLKKWMVNKVHILLFVLFVTCCIKVWLIIFVKRIQRI